MSESEISYIHLMPARIQATLIITIIRHRHNIKFNKRNPNDKRVLPM